MRLRSVCAAITAITAATAVIATSAGGAQGTQGAGANGGTVLKIGWAQNPKTLNPFVGQDEEDYSIWAINWDLLINYSPKDLTPVPGIAQSWEISDDKKSVTFHLVPDAKWSDGKPITSADVKYSLQVLGSHGALFTSYTDNVTSIDTPDKHTVVVHTKRPDARVVGGLFIYILPKHIWGKVPVKELTGSYQPDIPLVGSGPYVVTDFQQNRFLEMQRNPNFRGPAPAYDKIEFIRYGNQDAAERALQLGEVDIVPEVSAGGFARLGDAAGHQDLPGLLAGVHGAGVQHVPGEDLPGRQLQPGDPGPRRAPGDRVLGQPGAHQRDRRPGHLIPGTRDPALLLQVVLPAARRTTIHTTRARPGRSSTTRGGSTTAAGRGLRGRRSCPSTCTCARSRRTTSRRRS